MNGSRKHILKLIIYIAAIAILTGGGIASGLFGSVGNVMDDIHIDPAAILRLIIMILLVMIIESVVLLVLNLIKPRSNRVSTVLTLISSAVRYGAVILCFCWGLMIIGVDISTVVASVGVLALIIGFGAESLIADVVTGIFMLFEDQYNVGDIVEVNGFRGTVRSIGVRTTTIEDAGGNVQIINNSNMSNILNRSNHSSRAVCTIGIPYETDVEGFEAKLPDVLEEIYHKRSDIFKSVPVYVGIDELADSAIMLKFVAEVDESNIFSGTRALNHDLLISFKKLGVEVPYNQLDIHTR